MNKDNECGRADCQLCCKSTTTPKQEFKQSYPIPHKCDESCVPWCSQWEKFAQSNPEFKQPYPSTGPGPLAGKLGQPTRTFPTGATRDVDNSKLDYEGFLSPFVLERFAQYMHECRLRNIPEGQTVRSSDNWQKGMPFDAYMKSMVRHVFEAWMNHRASGPTTYDEAEKKREDTLCAILFNVQGYLQELLVVKNAAYRPK